jgi:hypothetical protein
MPEGSRFDLVAKSGYAARGVVFLLVAGLAVFSGVAGERPETKSALSALLGQPFGRIWVGLIGLGLLGFVAWRLAQSLADSDGHGRDVKAIAIRTVLPPISALLHTRWGTRFSRTEEAMEQARRDWRDGSCRSPSAPTLPLPWASASSSAES